MKPGPRTTRICPTCGKAVTKLSCFMRYTKSFCNRKCYWAYRAKIAAGWVNIRGYRCIRVNGKNTMEHRYFMEQHLGRKLQKGEDVHHRNGNKTDNCIKNLQLLPHTQHMRGHLGMQFNNKLILNLRKKGCNFSQIGKHLGTSKENIRAYFIRNGWHTPQKERKPYWDLSRALFMLHQGCSFAEIGRQLCASPPTIYTYLVNHKLYTAPKERNPKWDYTLARRLRKKGLTFAAIARQIGVLATQVHGYFVRHGYHVPKKYHLTKNLPDNAKAVQR